MSDAERLDEDYKTQKEASLREYFSMADSAVGSIHIRAPWAFAEIRHETWDQLSGVSEHARSWEDRLRPEVIRRLRSRLEEATWKLSLIATKYVAHGATAESRELDGVNGLTTSIKDIDRAYRVLCETTRFLVTEILGGPGLLSFLPATFDQCKHLDVPLAQTTEMSLLEKHWRAWSSECSSSANWSWSDFVTEFPEMTSS